MSPSAQHEKILQLATRVRQLEDALRFDHAQIADDQHPLLSEDLLKVKAPLQREPSTIREALNIKEEEGNPPLVDAFGALSIDVSGGINYYGHIVSSAVSALLFLLSARLHSDPQSYRFSSK